MIFVDVDGTLSRGPTGRWWPLWRVLETVVPPVKMLLPGTRWLPRLRQLCNEQDAVIITASRNRVGTLAWLWVRRIPHVAVVFTATDHKWLFYGEAPYLDADLPYFNSLMERL